jgi:hypothetical protein
MSRKAQYMRRLKTVSYEEKVRQLGIALEHLAKAVVRNSEETRQAQCDTVASELLDSINWGTK